MATGQSNGTCLISELCCGTNCCDPTTECCNEGSVCSSKDTIFLNDCNSCTHTGVDDSCDCIVKENSCPPFNFPCGDGCCGIGQVCVSCGGGIPVCANP